MLVFLDTNIILDYIDAKRRIIFPESARVFELAERRDITLCASSLTFSNIAYILRKIDYAELLRIFEDLRLVVEILPTNVSVVDTAIKSSFTDFEDAIQFYTACQGGVDVIVTRNIDDFVDNSITVMSPSSFLQSISR